MGVMPRAVLLLCFALKVSLITLTNRANAAFLWCRIYRVYDFRVGNNVLVTSQLVFTSRELVKKKAARVGEWLATFTLFPLSPVQKAGNNATDRVSCTHYFMSIEIIRCSVRRIETTKPDKKTICAKITLYRFTMTQQCAVAGLPRKTNDGYFDAANANKSCVRVHVGQSSEFPIYPTTRERGIIPLIICFNSIIQSCYVQYQSNNVSDS